MLGNPGANNSRLTCPSPLRVSCPKVPDVENPEFFKIMDRLVKYNTQIANINKMNLPKPLRTLLTLPLIERMVAGIWQSFIMTPLESGSVDQLSKEAQTQVVY